MRKHEGLFLLAVFLFAAAGCLSDQAGGEKPFQVVAAECPDPHPQKPCPVCPEEDPCPACPKCPAQEPCNYRLKLPQTDIPLIVDPTITQTQRDRQEFQVGYVEGYISGLRDGKNNSK